MKTQIAFLNMGKMLKGGLHCHTTRSDGRVDPADCIKLHKENGYDFLAITDHRRYNYENFAPECGVTIIPGMEFDNSLPCDRGFRCFHNVVIGPEKSEGNPYEQDQTFVSGRAPDSEAYQATLDEFHNNKNLTIYAHPQWSSTPARYFEKQKGNFAMEIWNSGSAINNEIDCDAAYWDELLGQGIRIFGVASDDGHALNHHCKGWVRVNAENNVNAILAALSEGKFYSSNGPELYNFSIDETNGHLTVDCSEAVKLRIHADRQPTRIVRAPEGATHFEYDIDLKKYSYVRISVVDKNGKIAWANPIFLDEE